MIKMCPSVAVAVHIRRSIVRYDWPSDQSHHDYYVVIARWDGPLLFVHLTYLSNQVDVLVLVLLKSCLGLHIGLNPFVVLFLPTCFPSEEDTIWCRGAELGGGGAGSGCPPQNFPEVRHNREMNQIFRSFTIFYVFDLWHDIMFKVFR